MARVSLFALLTISLVSIIRAVDVCPDPVIFSNSAVDANFVVSNAEQYSTCTTSSDNIIFDTGSNPPSANLGIGAALETASLPYTCAQYRTATQTKFGRYTCRMKAQNTPGVVSSCYFGSATNGPSYQEIYFRFYGTNNTRVHVGFYTSAGVFDKELPVTFQTDAEFQTYTIDYENNYIRWYINGVSQISATSGVGASGNTPIPSSNGFFRVSYVTSSGTTDENKKYGVYDGRISTIEVANMTYIPSCSSSIDLSSEDPSTSQSQDESKPVWARDCVSKSPFVIYGDSLADGVTDSSGSTIHNLNNKEQSFSGSSISWNVEDGSKISFTLAKPVPLDETGYWAIEMWLLSDNINKQITITLYSGTTAIGNTVSFSDYYGATSTLTPWQWMRVQIPISAFRANLGLVESFNRIELNPTYADFFGVLYMDNIKLTHGAPCLGKSQVIYDDALAEGWKDNSWGTFDLGVTDNAESGKAMYLRLYNGGLRLHANNGISTNDWFAISFDMLLVKDAGLTGNPSINVGITSNGADYKSYPLANYYGGIFPAEAGQYVTVSIPLYDFGIYQDQVIDGFWIQDNSGANEGKLYVDNVKLQQKYVDPNGSDSSFASPLATCSVALVAISAAALML